MLFINEYPKFAGIPKVDHGREIGGAGEPLVGAGDVPVPDADPGGIGGQAQAFGRIRSLNEAALQQYLATEEARKAVQIALVAEVANAYLTLLADAKLLPISASEHRAIVKAIASGDPAARRQAGNLSLNGNRITPLDL